MPGEPGEWRFCQPLSFLPGMRYYAGNWDTTLWCIKPSAEQKIAELNASGKWSDPIVTQVVPADRFWRAEEYHQRYFEKNGGGFCHI